MSPESPVLQAFVMAELPGKPRRQELVVDNTKPVKLVLDNWFCTSVSSKLT